MMLHDISLEQLVTRIKSEYIEMPGLWLTAEQGARLWAIERRVCEELLVALVKQRFLIVRADGKYGRAADDHTSERRQTDRTLVEPRPPTAVPAKAPLP